MNEPPELYTIKFQKKWDYLIHWYFWVLGFIYSMKICWELITDFLNWIKK